MSEKSMSKDIRKNVILLHIAVMCFSFSGVIGQYVQVPAVQVAMGRVICSSLLLLAISLVCKDKLTLDSKKDYGLMIMTGVVMAIHWSSFFQSIQTSSVAIGTITFSTFPISYIFRATCVPREDTGKEYPECADPVGRRVDHDSGIFCGK